jgi:hypothetical protein
MRFDEFAPQHSGGHGDSDEHQLPWPKVVQEAVQWFASHGFKAKHAPGADAIQFSKELDDDQEQVWLMGIIENKGEHIGFQFGSITDGEMDEPLEDYRGEVAMTSKGLNHVLLLAEEAFGL